MFQLNGKKIGIDRDLTIEREITVGNGDEQKSYSDQVTYPAGSLQNSTLRDELGIVEVPDLVRPDDRLYFVVENEDGSYTTSPRPRDQVTAPVWESIKARREQIKSSGVKVGEKWFHTDDASRIQQIGLVMMGSAIPANLQWKTMDGSFVTMTQALATQVFHAVAGLDMQAFAAAETHREAMLATENPFEYDFSAGWPASYTPEQ